MGGRSSKVVITPETQDSAAAAPEGRITQLKGASENGNGEPIPSIDGTPTTNEQNGDCSLADVTASTIPATDGDSEVKLTHKKNPISWIQKKISFKKVKTPKKSDRTEQPTEDTEGASPQKEGDLEGKEAVGDVEVQADEVPRVSQGTTCQDATVTEQITEPVVEMAPTSNGYRERIGEEQFVDDAQVSHEIEAEALDVHEEEPKVDVELSEKLGDLGLDSSQPHSSVDVDVCANGDVTGAALGES